MQPLLQGSDTEDFDKKTNDKVILQAHRAILYAREKMVEKHSKNYYIKVFTQGEIVLVKLLRGTRTFIDLKRVYEKVLFMLYPHKYEIQT